LEESDKKVNRVYYTYILHSKSHPDQYYTGFTADLTTRLEKHNEGDVPHTAKFVPWEIETYFAFKNEKVAKNAPAQTEAERSVFHDTAYYNLTVIPEG